MDGLNVDKYSDSGELLRSFFPKSWYNFTGKEYKGGALESDITAIQTTIRVTHPSKFPQKGTVIIGDEYITFRLREGAYLKDCTRGFSNTTASIHNAGDTLSVYPVSIAKGFFEAVGQVLSDLGGTFGTTLTTAIALPISDRIVTDLSKTGLVLIIEDTTSFPASGYVGSGDEVLHYASKTSTTFVIDERGCFNTTVEEHYQGDAVVLGETWYVDDVTIFSLINDWPLRYIAIGTEPARYHTRGTDNIGVVIRLNTPVQKHLVGEKIWSYTGRNSYLDLMRFSYFIRTALGPMLDTLGRNFMIPRFVNVMGDVDYREFMAALVGQPRAVLGVFEQVLEIIYGVDNYYILETGPHTANKVVIAVRGADFSKSFYVHSDVSIASVPEFQGRYLMESVLPFSDAYLGESVSPTEIEWTLYDSEGMPTSGIVRCDSEVISYTGLTSGVMTGITRGESGTVAAVHDAGSRCVVIDGEFSYAPYLTETAQEFEQRLLGDLLRAVGVKVVFYSLPSSVDLEDWVLANV